MSTALQAISQICVSHPDNWCLTETIERAVDDDWSIVACGVSVALADVEWALALLRAHFREMVRTPGPCELRMINSDPVRMRDKQRYEAPVEMCRSPGIHTFEDNYPWSQGAGGSVVVASVLVLYHCSFLAPGATTAKKSFVAAYDSGVACSGDFLPHSGPHRDRASGCRARAAFTEERPTGFDAGTRTVLVPNWPLGRRPTEVLRHPEGWRHPWRHCPPRLRAVLPGAAPC